MRDIKFALHQVIKVKQSKVHAASKGSADTGGISSYLMLGYSAQKLWSTKGCYIALLQNVPSKKYDIRMSGYQ